MEYMKERDKMDYYNEIKNKLITTKESKLIDLSKIFHTIIK